MAALAWAKPRSRHWRSAEPARRPGQVLSASPQPKRGKSAQCLIPNRHPHRDAAPSLAGVFGVGRPRRHEALNRPHRLRPSRASAWNTSEIDSLMRVPMKSLQPALRQNCAKFGPSFTHEAWRLGIPLLNMMRETAYILTTSALVAPLGEHPARAAYGTSVPPRRRTRAGRTP